MVQPGLANNLFVLFSFAELNAYNLEGSIFAVLEEFKCVNTTCTIACFHIPRTGRPIPIMKKLIRSLLNVKVNLNTKRDRKRICVAFISTKI